jgi:hypothetical protein
MARTQLVLWKDKRDLENLTLDIHSPEVSQSNPSSNSKSLGAFWLEVQSKSGAFIVVTVH